MLNRDGEAGRAAKRDLAVSISCARAFPCWALALACFAGGADAMPCALDPDYGQSGGVSLSFEPGPVYGIDAVLDHRDRLVVAVSLYTEQRIYFLVRLDRDGTLDRDFGNRGLVAHYAAGPGWYNVQVTVAVDQQNDMYLTGQMVRADGTKAVFSAKYDESGAPDFSFGDNGISVIPTLGQPWDSLIDAKSRLVVALSNSGVIRFDEFGQVDPTFGQGGLASLPGLAQEVRAFEDRLVFGGSGPYSLWAARLLENGAMDASFGAGGTAWLSTQANSTLGGLAVDAIGNVVVSGSHEPSTPFVQGEDIVLARFDAAGQPVTSFGVNGVRYIQLEPLARSKDEGGAVLLRDDGGLDLIGTTRPRDPSAATERDGDLVFMRVDASGDPTSLDCDGVTRLATGSGRVGRPGKLLANGRRMLAVGTDGLWTGPDKLIIRAIEPGLIFRNGLE